MTIIVDPFWFGYTLGVLSGVVGIFILALAAAKRRKR
jgi:hypothetical protein